MNAGKAFKDKTDYMTLKSLIAARKFQMTNAKAEKAHTHLKMIRDGDVSKISAYGKL